LGPGDGWEVFVCTDPKAAAQWIVDVFARRALIEQVFHDLEDLHRAGQQQVRDSWTNVAVQALNL
jgi:hypothetical protein